jgi:hypothetical protein
MKNEEIKEAHEIIDVYFLEAARSLLIKASDIEIDSYRTPDISGLMADIASDCKDLSDAMLAFERLKRVMMKK